MQILTVEKFKDVVRTWSRLPAPFVDVETNGLPVHDPNFRLVCLSITGYYKEASTLETIQIPLAHQEGQNAEIGMVQALAEFFESYSIGAFWVQTEAPALFKTFQVYTQFLDDPYIALRMLQDLVADLKGAVEKHLGRRMMKIEEVLPPGVYDFSLVHAQDPKAIQYSESDSWNGFDLARWVDEKMLASKMTAVYRLEVQAASFMSKQSLVGYEIDLSILKQELENEDRELVRLEKEIFEMLGCEPFKLNSGPKLGLALAKLGLYSPVRTKPTAKGGGGNDSWAKPVLEQMVRQGLPKLQSDCLKSIVDWKSRFSTRNSLRKSPVHVSMDGRIHPTWKTIGFDGTARMYAEDPSITSFVKGCRRAMKAPKGKRWMKFDWKQAEIRALAAASQDKALIEALNSGQDFHSVVYARMKGIKVEEVTPEQRESSKVISYSILYSGGSPYHVSAQLGIEMDEAIKLVREYFQLFPVLKSFLDEVRAKAVKTYHVRTFMNRVRRLEGGDEEKIMNQACDAMGQQSIGTALKIALAKMEGQNGLGHPCMKGLCQVIPVFDAIFYCIDDSIPLDVHIGAMKDFVQLNMAGVVLEADFATGPTWGDLTKVYEGYAEAAEQLSDTEKALERRDAETIWEVQ